MVAVSTCAAVVALAGWSPSALRSPAVLALAGLAALSALSAAWTVASANDALRWGVVIGALTLIAVSASIVCERVGPMPIAAVIAIAAAVAGAVGLYGAGARVEPLAQRLGGQWSPGGPLEYAPALALLQVSALPVLMAAMARARDRVAATAAIGAAIAGAAVALAGSRVELALGIASCDRMRPDRLAIDPGQSDDHPRGGRPCRDRGGRCRRRRRQLRRPLRHGRQRAAARRSGSDSDRCGRTLGAPASRARRRPLGSTIRAGARRRRRLSSPWWPPSWPRG